MGEPSFIFSCFVDLADSSQRCLTMNEELKHSRVREMGVMLADASGSLGEKEIGSKNKKERKKDVEGKKRNRDRYL